jgi:hypothetical protein
MTRQEELSIFVGELYRGCVNEKGTKRKEQSGGRVAAVSFESSCDDKEL